MIPICMPRCEISLQGYVELSKTAVALHIPSVSVIQAVMPVTRACEYGQDTTPVTCLAALAHTWQGSQLRSTIPGRRGSLEHSPETKILGAALKMFLVGEAPSGARDNARNWEVSVSMPMRDRNKRFKKLSMNARVSSYGWPFRRCKSCVFALHSAATQKRHPVW